MAIMTKMRDSMPVILIGLVVVFIFTIVFEWGMDYLGMNKHSDTVGVIEGKKISYQEFSELVRQQAEQYKKQSNQEPDDNAYKQIREQVWNNLVTQTLLDRETKKAGIKVTDQEIVDWVLGENPPEFLTQQFRDSTGHFNREAYESAIRDPRNKDIWIQVESGLRQQRLAEKMQSVVYSSLRITDGEMKERFINQNMKANLQYAFFNPDLFITDANVTVTDDDLKKIYSDNPEEFKVNASRKVKYLTFNDQPTAKDSEGVKNDLMDVLNKAKAGTDFEELAKEYQENLAAPVFYKHGELTKEKEDAIFSAKVGDIVGPTADNEGYHLFKILEEKKGDETFVKASHILLKASSPEQEAEARKLAAQLISRARAGEDFHALAKQYSTEPGASISGGELGWFGKGRMVKEFEQAALNGKPGQVIGPVKTQFGIHIIKIEAKDNRQVKVATITMSVKASSKTRDDAFQRAQDFAYLAKKGSFDSEAKSLGLQVLETPEFQKGGMVPGLGFFEPINKFAFNHSVGDISEVYSVNNGYAVVMISEEKKEGIRPFDEVKNDLKPRALRKKKMAQLLTTIQQKYSQLGPNGDLASLSGEQNVQVQTTGDFNVGGGIPTVGREFALNGASQSGEIGKILPPVEGTRGYYLVKILTRSPFDTAAYNAQKNILQVQLLQEKKQRILSQWLEKLKETASIEDDREQFFR
jgi:peptidyl-prolyl cis-trans isomerase D